MTGAALITAACGGADPTPTPLPAPAPTPEPPATAAPARPSPTPRASDPSPTPTSTTESVIQYVTAYAYLDRGNFAEAERYFTTVIELEPNFARGWDGRGQARLFKGEYDEALLDFDQAISLKPALATAYAHRAFARMATRDPSGALRDAEKALSLNNNLVDPQIVLGRVLAEQGKLDEALSHFDRAVALTPQEGGVYWWRGRFYRDVLRDYARALEDFNRAVQYDPARAQIFLDRAVLLISGGAPVELIRGDLEEAISLSKDPLLPEVLDQAERLLGIVAEAERTGAPIIIPRR